VDLCQSVLIGATERTRPAAARTGSGPARRLTSSDTGQSKTDVSVTRAHVLHRPGLGRAGPGLRTGGPGLAQEAQGLAQQIRNLKLSGARESVVAALRRALYVSPLVLTVNAERGIHVRRGGALHAADLQP